jgi:hypothetical protein
MGLISADMPKGKRGVKFVVCLSFGVVCTALVVELDLD